MLVISPPSVRHDLIHARFSLERRWRVGVRVFFFFVSWGFSIEKRWMDDVLHISHRKPRSFDV